MVVLPPIPISIVWSSRTVRALRLSRCEVKPFTVTAAVLLSLIAVMQLLRFVLGWHVTVNGVVVPVWLSGIAFVVAGGLAVALWWERRR